MLSLNAETAEIRRGPQRRPLRQSGLNRKFLFQVSGQLSEGYELYIGALSGFLQKPFEIGKVLNVFGVVFEHDRHVSQTTRSRSLANRVEHFHHQRIVELSKIRNRMLAT